MLTQDGVLILAGHGDPHAATVCTQVRSLGAECFVLDNSDFPTIGEAQVLISQDRTGVVLKHPDVGELDMSSISSVWWRRPQEFAFGQSVRHPTIRGFAKSEWYQTLAGAVVSMVPTFINPIHASRRATLKLLQLRFARDLGIRIPRTLVTNSPAEALDFYKSNKSGCVYKTFTGCDFGMFETRRISSDDDLSDLTRLTTCPTIFQEYIEGDFDLRVIVVGKDVFAAKIDYKKGRHPVDSRVDHVPIDPIDLPSELSAALIKMVTDFGLVYSAIDLRFSYAEGYTFFELNPEGQFLYVEIEAGFPISRAMANALVAGRHVETKCHAVSI